MIKILIVFLISVSGFAQDERPDQNGYFNHRGGYPALAPAQETSIDMTAPMGSIFHQISELVKDATIKGSELASLIVFTNSLLADYQEANRNIDVPQNLIDNVNVLVVLIKERNKDEANKPDKAVLYMVNLKGGKAIRVVETSFVEIAVLNEELISSNTIAYKSLKYELLSSIGSMDNVNYYPITEKVFEFDSQSLLVSINPRMPKAIVLKSVYRAVQSVAVKRKM